MSPSPDPAEAAPLPDDVATLKALLLAERASAAEAEQADATLQASRTQQRRVNRGALPKHLPREDIVIEPDEQTCPCCGGTLHRIGEDVPERVDVVPAQFRGIVTR